LLWMPTQGKIFYTLNNKLIEEDTKVRKQVIYADSEVRLSCLAHNVHNAKYIAVGEGEPNLNSQFESFIWVYDMSI
jgi:WD40 repeat protein